MSVKKGLDNSLSFNRKVSGIFPIRAGTSISASVHSVQPGKYSLRVFAAEDKIASQEPQIYDYKFKRDPDSNEAKWDDESITDAVTQY
nr:hypothetical protein FVER53263_20023 [Fusarium verticillioides]